MSEDKRRKWDRIETEYHFEELTQFGYESALKQLFVDSGIVLKASEDMDSNEVNCSENYVKLLEENKELKNRIEILEKQLNKN